jgi:hypothetical protein
MAVSRAARRVSDNCCGRKAIDVLTQTVYEEYAGSWLFHPENFRAKLEDESYLVQHSHRAQFLKKWIPERYPDYKLKAEQEGDFAGWTARTRQDVRECVFTMFPNTATRYYVKRCQHVKEIEERKLRELITTAIPIGTDGWSDAFILPPIVIQQPPSTDTQDATAPQPALVCHGALTPPSSPVHQAADLTANSPELDDPYSDPRATPVHIDALPRQPPYSCKPGPPPQSMSAAARLACLARWTAFSPTGTPYLLATPHAKDFDLQWHDAIDAGFSEEDLVKWAQEIWWDVWARQCVVNWRGMWAKRFEKEDTKAKKARKVEEEKADSVNIEEEARAKAEELVRAHKQKVMGRLEGLNRALGLMVVNK